MSVRLAVVVCALVLIGTGSSAAAAVKGASGAKLVQFVRPTGDTLVQKGSGPIRVIVHVGAGVRLTRVDVDGVVVTGLLRRGAGGDYRGRLSLTSHLHYGYNDAFAQAVGSNGHRAHSHVRFIVAQRDNSLLRLTSFRTETTAAPLQVAVHETTGTHVRAALSVADGVSARVYVNRRRVDRGFSQQRRRLMVALGAGEGLRFGRNLVQILVHKTHAFKRQSKYDFESRTVYIPRNAPIASAGANRTLTQHGLARFDGRRTKLPRGWTRPQFRWKIVSAPRGSRARLRNASGQRPTLVPRRPGRYQVRVSVRARRPGASRALASVALASGTGASNDTATVTVMPDIPPVGVPLLTQSENGSVTVKGQPIPGTGGCSPRWESPCTLINYVVLDRQTLQPAARGYVQANLAGMQNLGSIVDQYSGSLNYLVVLNWAGFAAGDEPEADRNALGSVLQKIGAQQLTAAQRQLMTPDKNDIRYSPGSAVGVAGAPAGSAFLAFGYPPSCQNECIGISGTLRLNGVTAKYDFVFTDAVEFDTETNQTAADISPAQLTFKVGNRAITAANPGGGVSGFHLVRLDWNTLYPDFQQVYATNAADGAEQPDAVQRLASDLNDALNDPNRPLVMLQAFGAPHGNDGPWDQVAREIERLGGTRQVFDALNAVDPRALNGEDPNRKGPYAFVGRAGATAPRAEQSYSLNGLPGRLQGVLMRARDGGYEPMIAAPPRSDGQLPLNTQLIHVANQAPRPFPAFKDANGQPIDNMSVDAVEKFLGAATKLCSSTAPTCDIRKSYYQDYRANWSSIQDDLTNATQKCIAPPQGSVFTAAQCEGVRAQLHDEVSEVAEVTQYFGPSGLQEPFAEGGAYTQANLTDITQTINNAVAPPPAENTTSSFLTALSYVSLLGNAAPETTALGNTLNAAFLLGAYFTRHDGSPDLIGPQVTTAASKLGVELADRYQQAGDHLDDLGRLIVSDYGKLTAVAGKVNAEPGPGETDWRLGNVGLAREGLVRAAKQTIYERLVPLAYPVMYDLGPVGNARDWYCDGGHAFFVPLPDKHLFADQADGAQFIGRFDQWTTRIAVAQAHATGSVGDARIPGIPGTITDTLFAPPAQGGLGLNKLEFYSPRNGFRYLPASPGVPVLHDSTNDDLGSLFEWPYNRENLGFQVAFCSDLPDPPGNSG